MKVIFNSRFLAAVIFSLFIFSVNNSIAQLPSGNGGSCVPPSGPQGPPGSDGGGTEWIIDILVSRDPNEIIAPEGYDSIHWVARKDIMGYTINFENDPRLATAPAKNVFLFYPIPPKQDMASFRLGSFGFNKDVFNVPENVSFYSSRLDLRDSLGIFVDVTAGIDVVNSRAFWIFESIDPATGLPPEDALVGMLPVKDSTITLLGDTLAVDGEGFVNFSIKPKNNSQTGDEVLATAKIVFDINDTILTNTELNTIDAFPPASQITASTVSGNSVTLHFAASDDGSGVRDYDLYVAQDTLNFITYLTKATDSVFIFTGALGSQYHFFSLATDNTGNREVIKSGPDVSVSFTSGCPTLVTNANDVGAGSLREVINCAEDGSTISFASNMLNQIIVLSSEIQIDKNLTLAGPGLSSLTISGNSMSRIFHLLPSNNFLIRNITLENASAVTNGGAILVEGILTLENVLLENNFENGLPKALSVINPGLLCIEGSVQIKD